MAMAASLSSTATAVAASSSCHHRLVLTRRFHHDHYLLSPIIAAHHNNSLSQYYYYSAGINHHLGRKSSGSAIIRLASSSQSSVNTMKLPPLAYPPFMVVAALSSVSFSSQARAFVTQPSYLSFLTTPKIIPSTQNKRCVSSSSSSPAKELSVSAAYDESTTTTTTPSNTDAMIVQGEILSYYSASSSSSNTNYGSLGSSTLVVVKICEEDLIPPITKLSAAGLGAGVDGSVPMATTTGTTTVQRSPVGLEKSLFSKSGSSTAVTKDNTNSLKRIIADGDPTGRTVTFSNGSKGTVLANRHPISFVLVDASVTASVTADSNDTNSYTVGDMCSISTELATLTPSSIPPGSTVDYLGRHISLLKDGSVSRSLPKAAAETSSLSPPIVGSTSTDGQFLDMWNSKLSTVTPTVSSSSSTTTTIGKKLDEQRPIFVSIPKISDIGLIDSPLVTGITAIDALTPIGLGQNMLVISEEGGRDDGDDVSCGKVNKRGWMMNLLRNVVANHKTKEGNSRMRCYYCLTSGDSNIRSSVWDGIMQAGIQEDIVTLFSNYDSSSSAASSISDKNDASLEAAEAVAVAAAACTLGEHHALTTGGDSLVIIDDINLHKSLWDMTTQELVKVYGVNAVVEADLNGGSSSEMRGFFSGLIQRAARYNVKKGGGSVTLILLSTLPNLDEEAIHDVEDEPTFVASDFDSMSEKIKDRIAMLVKAKVPLTPTNLRKIKLPVPKPSENENAKRLALQHVEDLISMSDGQIWFDAKQGRSPPLDPSRSLTRVGVGADTRNCRADAPALRSVVGSLRFEFQQATDMMSPNSAEGAGKNAKQALRRDAFLLAMHQEPNEGRKLSEECVALLAASRGYLDAVIAGGGMPGTRKGKEALARMLEYVQNNTGEILHSVDETLDLSFDERNILDEAISEYFS